VALRLLFEKVATHWERKKRKSQTSDSKPPQVDEGDSHHGAVPGESQAAAPETPAAEDEVSGDKTPDTKPKVHDEYLAWTLGGDLCPTLGFEPDTPEEKSALDIDEQLKELETLG